MRGLTVTSNKDGYSAGCYDHIGNYGHVVYGESTIETLRKKIEKLGYWLIQ